MSNQIQSLSYGTAGDPASSPFEGIKRLSPDGAEYWSARDLMPLMGYAAWREFKTPLTRAMKTAENQGIVLESHFGGSPKMVDRPQGGGRPRDDFHLSRFAAYLVAMNGDPNKPQVAAAQSYFAVKTREAEVARPALSGPALMAAALLEADRTMKALSAQVDTQDRRLKLVEPKASAWDMWLSANPNYQVAAVAQALHAAGVPIGQGRLFKWLRDHEWIARHDNRPCQTAIETKRMALKLGSYENAHTGERVATVTPRITAKGAAKLAVEMGALPQTVMDSLEGTDNEQAA